MTLDEREAQKEIALANKFITKSYLNDLTKYEVVPLEDCQKRFQSLRLYLVEKIVYDKYEDINDKLISVFNAIQSLKSNVVLVIKGYENSARLYIGIQSNTEAGIAEKVFSKGFMGNFPGSIITKISSAHVENVMSEACGFEGVSSCVSCLNAVPSLRTEQKDNYVQGLEKFIDTMKGENYSCVVIASTVTNEECETRMKGYEQLYSALFPFVNLSLSHGTTEGITMTEGFTTTVSESIATGITKTTGQNTTEGTNTGFNFGLLGLAGINMGKSHSTGTSTTSGTTDTRSTQTGASRSTTESRSNTVNDNFTVSYKDKILEDALKRVEQQIDRLRECVLFGMWECAAYFVANNVQTSVVAANSFRSLLFGDDKKSEKSYLNSFGLREQLSTQRIVESIKYGHHPLFRVETPHGDQIVSATDCVSGKELPLMIALPRKSVSGLSVSSMAEFGRNIVDTSKKDGQSGTVLIGKIYHMDREENTDVRLDVKSLASHCFVTGSTGSGKSNTTFCLLSELIKENNRIPFLVIEPAKGEYKYEFCNLPGINIFCTNALIGRFFKINPFRFNPAVHILEHLDRLVEIFNTCWEMYAAMPAILKDAIEKTYEKKGWDLLNSVYVKEGLPQYPTFKDLLAELPLIINQSGYSSDTKGDYIGALVTRVNSLTNGIIGQIFCDCSDIPDEVLFDQNTIVDLSRIGSSETKSLIMGVLVLKLTEHRMSDTGKMNVPLRHVTVLEEAHNLLKNTRNSASPASAVVSKSVEMICNSIAEVRAYGEGFILVDQSPTAVDVAAIKNTNTKIIMRLPEMSDCETVGRSVSLNDDQINELSRLKTGIAVVMQNNWSEAVLAKVNLYPGAYSGQPSIVDGRELLKFKSAVIGEILNQYTIQNTRSAAEIIEVIERFDISADKKADAKQTVADLDKALKTQWDSRLLGNVLIQLIGAESAFRRSERIITPQKDQIEEKELRTWSDSISSEIERIVQLNERQQRRLIQYMTYAKSFEDTDVNYGEIYKMKYIK